MRFWRSVRPHYLSLESKGEAVTCLQVRLQELGYDPGPADGYFGYQTHAAVSDFQRDFGLRTDGVAGPRLFELLKQKALPTYRQAYVLAPGENLNDAARALDTSVEALRYMNRLPMRSRGYPGQRIVCRSHYVLGALSGDDASIFMARKASSSLSALATPGGVISAGELQVQPPCEQACELARENDLDLWLSLVPASRLSGEALERGIPALGGASRRRLRYVAREAAALGREIGAGIWLDIGQIRRGDGSRLQQLVRFLREEQDKHGGQLMLSLPLSARRAPKHWWLTDIDYAGLAATADRVVLATHCAGYLESFLVLEKRIRALLQVMPPWKTLLGVALRAEERDYRGQLLGEVGYTRAITTVYLAGVRPRWDEERRLFLATLASGEDNVSAKERVFWLPGRDAIIQRLHLLNRLNLAGFVLWPLGEEDARIWVALPRYIKAERLKS